MQYSAHIRRRAMFAFRALSHFHPNILDRAADKLSLKFTDQDPFVAVVVLTFSVSLVEVS